MFPQQKLACGSIIEHYQNGSRMVQLMAQMQSGKTGCFLGVALNAIHLGIVSKVVIICGSNEMELHHQLCDSIMTICSNKDITAYKNNELSTLFISSGTLLIWDESHYAQTKGNRPDEFFKKNGLSPISSQEAHQMWEDKDCYYLSVSATPYSEFIDNTESQWKKTVLMSPGKGYRGVEFYHTNRKIKPSFSPMEYYGDFCDILEKYRTPGYAIVRVSKEEQFYVKNASIECKWRVLHYDSTKRDIQSLDNLQKCPKYPTIVLIKGMCRMGKVIPKKYIHFVFDGSLSSHSDTAFQSLLGRMCGYGPWSKKIPRIYVSPRLFKIGYGDNMNDITRYIKMMNGECIVPISGRNIGSSRKNASAVYSIVPHFIPYETHPELCDKFVLARNTKKSQKLKEEFVTDFLEYYRQENLVQDPVQNDELDHILQLRKPEHIRQIAFRNFNEKSYTEHGISRRFIQHYKNREPFSDLENNVTLRQQNKQISFIEYNGYYGFFFTAWTKNGTRKSVSHSFQKDDINTTCLEVFNPIDIIPPHHIQMKIHSQLAWNHFYRVIQKKHKENTILTGYICDEVLSKDKVLEQYTNLLDGQMNVHIVKKRGRFPKGISSTEYIRVSVQY